MRPDRSAWNAKAASFATPRQPRGGWLAQHQKTVLAAVAVVVIILLLVSYDSDDTSTAASYLRGQAPGSPFDVRVDLDKLPNRIKFSIIADLDKRSRRKTKKPSWFSLFKTGYLVKHATGYNVTWEAEHEVITKHGEAGRGMELSELLTYNGAMYSFDDRSGIVYEIADYLSDTPKAYPRHILMEGNGDTNKGFKIEWATRKNGDMYIGSFGKEYTDNEGNVVNSNNMWIKIIDSKGHVRHTDWTEFYVKLRRHVHCPFPGYLLHEAAVWSDSWQRWMFFPRRQSSEPYSDVLDEKRGTNIMLIADEDFRNIDVRTVIPMVPERGFSSVKEIPTVDGSHTSAVIALRSAESDEEGTQSAFLSVLGFDQVPLMAEVEIEGGFKYEGIEILEIMH